MYAKYLIHMFINIYAVCEREPDSYNDVGDVRDVRRDQHQPHIDTYNLRQHDDGASNIQIREIRFLHHKTAT